MNRKTLTVISAVLMGLQPTFAALPPSQQSNEETLWNALSVSAQLDLNSAQTAGLIDKFLQTYPDHPKAVNALYMLGETEFAKGNYQKAAVRFENFLSKYPEHEIADSAAYRLGECYFNAQAYNSAAEAWSRMVARYKHSALVPNALEQLMMINMRSREWGKADEVVQKIRSQYPEYALINRVRENRGIIQYQMGDYSDAAKTLDGIDEGKGAYYRGLSLFSLTLYSDAIAALKNVGQDVTGPYAESAVFLKAEGFFQKRNYNLASKEFQAFVKRFPTSTLVPYAHMRTAACELLVHEPEEALKFADLALKDKAPVEVQAYGIFIKGSAYIDMNKFNEAISLFDRLSKSKEYPNLAAAALVRKAWAHRALGQVSQFSQSLKRLEEEFPESPQMSLAKFLEGSFLFEQGRWEDAGRTLEYGIMRYPYNPISEAGLALMTISYSKGKKLDQLLTAGNSALKLFEDSYSPQTGEWRAQAYYFIGKAYYDLSRYSEALPYFDKITQNFSEHALAPRAQLYLAWCLAETGKLDQARDKARVLMENTKIEKPLQIGAKFLYAVTFFNSKQYDKAITRLADFVKNNSKDSLAPEAQYLIGLSYHQKKVFGSAIEEWVKLINQYPDNELSQEAYIHIGDLYFRGGKFEDSAKFFGQFREKWPQSKYEQDTMWLEMQSYFNGKMDEKAVKLYPIYLEKFPNADNIADANRQLEIVYYRRGAHGDPAKLEEFLGKYPKSPYAPSARYKLGDMAMEQKIWPKAAEEMEQFLRDYPKDPQFVDAQYALGLAYENMGQKQKAMVQYKNLIDQFPSKPGAVDASFRLGMLFFKGQNYKEAIQAFEFAAKQKLNDDLKASVYYNLALSYENLGDVDRATAAYAQFAKITKRPDQAAEARLTAGLLLKKAEKYDKAIPYFTELIKTAGDKETEIQAVNFLAECYNATGGKDKAIVTYSKLIAMEPANNDARLAGLAQLAYLYEQKKSYAQAVKVYEKIAVSEGKKEWVKAAKERIQTLSQAQKDAALP